MLQNRLAQLREERANGDKGFTLIELLVVVVIIGILIAIAIPLYLHFENGAKDNSAQSDVHNAVAVVQQCSNDNDGTLPATADATVSTDHVTFKCGATTETATISNNNTFTYTEPNAAGGYTITVQNGDTQKTYTYDSTVGHIVGS